MSRQASEQPPKPPLTLGDRIAAARKEKGWTQPQLARALYDHTNGAISLTPGEISRYETNRVKNPRLAVISALAAVLDQPLEHFTGGVGLTDRLAELEETVHRILDLNETSFQEIGSRFDQLERRLDALAAQVAPRKRRAN